MRRLFWPVIVAVVMGAFPPFCGGCRAQGWEDAFFKANSAYREGRYAEAARRYRLLIRSGHENGHIYYNLGNACFRQGKLGRAILNYERARRFIPRDADLNFNLAHAREQRRDAVPETRGVTETAFFWLASLSLSEILWGFAVLNLLFWGILVVRVFTRPEWSYYVFLVLLAGWLAAGFSLGLKWHEEATDNRAVILLPEVSVLAGPDTRDTVLFKLHEGTVVYRERSEDGWSLIHLSDKKRGWVMSGAVEPVRLSSLPAPANRS